MLNTLVLFTAMSALQLLDVVVNVASAAYPEKFSENIVVCPKTILLDIIKEQKTARRRYFFMCMSTKFNYIGFYVVPIRMLR